MDDYRTVTIPGCAQHDGYTSVTARLPWKCIHCGAPRGEPYLSRSWDGSRQLECHSWINPCGHIETYSEVRKWMDAQAPAKGPDARGTEVPARERHPPCGEPVAWMHVQGNHFEPSLRELDDDEKARGWTQFPLYGAAVPAPQTPSANDVAEALKHLNALRTDHWVATERIERLLTKHTTKEGS